MSKLVFMPWYPSDYKADTAHLELEEHGAYRLLIDEIWLSGGTLKFDERRLARRLGVTTNRFKKIWSAIGEFFRLEGGEISHKRITAEIEKAQKNVEKRAEIARKAAAKRWKKPKKNSEGSMPDAMHEAMPEECQSEPEGSGIAPKGANAMNLTPEGALAMERLRASCERDRCLGEYDRFTSFVQGFQDGVIFVSGAYALDSFNESLKRPLRAEGLKLEIKPAATPLKAIQGGKA